MRTYFSIVSAGIVLATCLTGVNFSPAADPGLMVRPNRSSRAVADPGLVERSKPSSAVTANPDLTVSPKPSSAAKKLAEKPSALNKQVGATLNTQIALTAEKFKGQMVGAGKAADFVSEVLRLCNAQGRKYEIWNMPVSATQMQHIGSDGWGKEVAQYSAHYGTFNRTFEVGHIIQFESCYFEVDNRSRGLSNDWWIFGHHTAIVTRVEKGTVLTLLYQNINNGTGWEVVKEHVIDLNDLKRGSWKLYEALPQ